MESKLRTIIVGDIHSCLDEFVELLKVLSYNKETDRLILAGDLTDRGPFPIEVVRKVREMDVECCCGNHDIKILKWWKNKGSRGDVNHKPAYYEQLSDDDINFIAQMSPYIKIEEQNTIIVHAGLRPGIPLEKQTKDDLYYIRYMDEDQKFISLRKINSLGSKEAAGAHFWTEYGPFGYDIVYGHNVHSLTDIRIDKYDDGTACYGIDTGACFGGKLSALILETKEIVQVQAKREYYKSNFSIR